MLSAETANSLPQLPNVGDAPSMPEQAQDHLGDAQSGDLVLSDGAVSSAEAITTGDPTTLPLEAPSDTPATTVEAEIAEATPSPQIASPPPPQPSLIDPASDAVVISYPALPELGSRFSCMVYSHKSVYGGNAHLRGYDYVCEPRDNERLTFIGAAALQLFVGDYLYKRHALKSVGYLSQLRCYLTSKDMLAHWARQYAMPPLILAQESSLLNLRASTNVLSGIFEAYIGAIVEHPDFGLDAANRFVCTLINAQLSAQAEGEDDLVALRAAAAKKLDKEAVKETEGSEGTDQTASRSITPPQMSPTKAPKGAAGNLSEKSKLSIFNERASQLSRLTTWTEEAVGPEHSKSWKMIVFVDGVAMGEGLGDRKQTAKIAAAEKAWEALGWK